MEQTALRLCSLHDWVAADFAPAKFGLLSRGRLSTLSFVFTIVDSDCAIFVPLNRHLSDFREMVADRYYNTHDALDVRFLGDGNEYYSGFWKVKTRTDYPVSGLDCSMIRDFLAKLVRRTQHQHRCVKNRVVLNRTAATVPTMYCGITGIIKFWPLG